MSDNIAVAFSEETGKRCSHMAGILGERLYLGLYKFHTSGKIQLPSGPPGTYIPPGFKYDCFMVLKGEFITITVGYPQYADERIKDYNIIEMTLSNSTGETQIGDSIYFSSYEDVLNEIIRLIS